MEAIQNRVLFFTTLFDNSPLFDNSRLLVEKLIKLFCTAFLFLDKQLKVFAKLSVPYSEWSFH